LVLSIAPEKVFADEPIEIWEFDPDADLNYDVGDIEVDGEMAIDIYIEGGGKAKIKAKKLKTTNEPDGVIDSYCYDGSSVEIEAEDVEGDGYGIYLKTSEEEGEKETMQTVMAGDVSSNSSAVFIDNDGVAATTTVQAESATSENKSGVQIFNKEGLVGVTIENDSVGTFNEDFENTPAGVRVETTNGGFTQVEVEGTTAGFMGVVNNSTGENSISNVTVNDIESHSAGVNTVASNGGYAYTEVNGDITPTEELPTNAYPAGVWATSVGQNSEVVVSVDGTIEGNVGTSVDAYEGGEAYVWARDVDVDMYGVFLGADDDSTASMVIDGTLEADEIPVVVEGSLGNLNLTVWQITEGQDDVIAATLENEEGNPDPQFVQNEEFEQTGIHYIVKLEQPEQGGTIEAADENGEALLESHGYDTALENEKVILKVNLQNGYTLKGAYNGLGEKVALLVDENDNYYVIVPRGGGVYLSVELENESGDDPEPGPIIDDGYQIDFVDWDGTILQSGLYQPDEDVVYLGEEPFRPDDDNYTYRFMGWTPTVKKATKNQTYTAQYRATPKGSGGEEEVVHRLIDYTKDDHEIGSGKSYFIEVTGNKNDVVAIIVDGKDVTNLITLKDGSTIATMSAQFLDKLGAGSHTIKIVFGDGSISHRFKVVQKKSDKSEEEKKKEEKTSTKDKYENVKTGVDGFAVNDIIKNNSFSRTLGLCAVAAAMLAFHKNKRRRRN
jgi:hypothetical protein